MERSSGPPRSSGTVVALALRCDAITVHPERVVHPEANRQADHPEDGPGDQQGENGEEDEEDHRARLGNGAPVGIRLRESRRRRIMFSMAALIVVIVLLGGCAVGWLLRRGPGGDAYPDVPVVRRSEAEERRAHEPGLANLADLGGPGALAEPASAAAKQLDEETRRRRESGR
jgi:hypothetical protein